ncbi:MAG: NAD-dependent epimerase/dehydratase family protein [Magnetococcus sp. DMHC-6]
MKGDVIGGGRVLVTGAGGFIGGWLVRRLCRQGWPVRALVRQKPAYLEEGVEWFVGDLTVPKSLVGVEEGVTWVIHAAGRLGGWGVSASALRAVNVEGGVMLLERFSKLPPRCFVHLSAGGVSGPLGRVCGDETTVNTPATDYERCKGEAEEVMLSRAQQLGIPLVVVRPTFTYGPEDGWKWPLFRAIARRRFAFIGSGEAWIHPVHVVDVVEGILHAMFGGQNGEIYLIGGEEPVTWRYLVWTIAKAVGVTPPRVSIPLSVARGAAWCLEGVAGVVPIRPLVTRSRILMFSGGYGYSIAKARRELGYAPVYDLERGIAEVVASYQSLGWL